MIDVAADVDDVEMFFDQSDRRQEAISLQAVRVQIIGGIVRRHAVNDATLHRALEEPPENHRVGDVVHVKLVETDQPITPCEAACDGVERIFLALERCELAMDVAHEMVKVDASLSQRAAP